MIVAVEGASAAGKSSWCRSNAPATTVAELSAESSPEGDTEQVARYRVQRQSERWAEALLLEAKHGRAYCDSDPFKLHYTWCLWQLGEVDMEHWQAGCAAHRSALAAGQLGFADLVILLEPELAELRRRREADGTRSRRNFELHVRMAPLLRTWYAAIDSLDPGRVVWQAHQGAPIPSASPRALRSDPDFFDELIRSLPGAGANGDSR